MCIKSIHSQAKNERKEHTTETSHSRPSRRAKLYDHYHQRYATNRAPNITKVVSAAAVPSSGTSGPVPAGVSGPVPSDSSGISFDSSGSSPVGSSPVGSSPVGPSTVGSSTVGRGSSE
eukprot:Trichotokara_eunicae@DN5644_c1_g1_i6.p1